MSRFHRGALLALLACMVHIGHAQTPLTPVVRNGISYITGGVGKTEVEAFRSAAAKYNLRMTFASKTGSYLAEVDVSIWPVTGQRLMRVWTEGPFLFVRVPPGSYRIEVHLRSQSEMRTVQVPASGSTDVIFHLEDPDECGVIKICGRHG